MREYRHSKVQIVTVNFKERFVWFSDRSPAVEYRKIANQYGVCKFVRKNA